MRLLHTTKLTLHTFFDKDVPKYAILSHRWDEEEVIFQDLQSGRGPDMPGFAKIQGCCAQARSDGWEYAWIDSCCIDKSSSAELSEAINSMFKWYEKAMVCYVYLSDVDGKKAIPEQLEVSAWFTRGWTLQELLAPETVVFFDRYWRDIGTKSTLEDLISQITRIRDIFAWQECCVAEKMSWASRRGTTRVEDEAYCLMGIFDVNMPLLYGEGKKAFQRLQLEILNSSDDDSLFCWEDHDGFGSMLAVSPAAFESGYNIRHYPGRDPALSPNVQDPADHPHCPYPTIACSAIFLCMRAHSEPTLSKYPEKYNFME
ncbi:heterokaryon incompatibility protein-domain-containing protein [Rhexocercosporidium sp. MPI-PUGE-AT-0058]|nr:heterokaryon incompatibility protein-domain-containing protein [Rhexocercosporidium sp. MPI-PUGE-AT-0058]